MILSALLITDIRQYKLKKVKNKLKNAKSYKKIIIDLLKYCFSL